MRSTGRILGIALLFLFAVEALLRLAGLGDPPLAVRDKELEYRLVPDAEYRRWGNRIAINADGFRTGPVPTGLPAGEARLLLIGDSVVYGNHFLDQADTIAARLSGLLSTPDCAVRVIPMAVSSWGPVNQAAALRRHGLFEAQQVAVVLSAHDLIDTPTEAGALVPYRLAPPFGAIGDAVLVVYERFVRPRPGRTDGPSLEARAAASLAALDTIFETATAAGAEVLMVYNATTPERAQGIAPRGARLLDWAEARGLGVLNLASEPDVSYRDLIHPDAPGAAAIARALAAHYAGTVRCGSS